MSNDAQVTKDVMQTLEDGKEGYAQAADNIGKAGAPEHEAIFRRFSEQRAAFYADLGRMAANYGDDVGPSGSTGATLHRAWLSLREATSPRIFVRFWLARPAMSRPLATKSRH